MADELILLAGANLQQLHTESDKLAAYVGEREEVTRQDVHEIATRTKQAAAFALGDALGERNLPKLLRVLDEELWEVKLDTKKSPIALLYGLISKVRVMLFLREMVRLKWINPKGGISNSNPSSKPFRRIACRRIESSIPSRCIPTCFSMRLATRENIPRRNWFRRWTCCYVAIAS